MILNSPYISGSLTVTGNQILSGSLNVVGGIIGTVTGVAESASYVDYNNVDNKPTLVSGSSQISFNGIVDKPTLVSSSQQILDYNIFATTGSNQFNGNQTITGSLTVTSQIIAQTLNVQQVTSSVVYSSGSNVFGNDVSNTHQFTGSLFSSGSVAIGTSSPLSNLHIVGNSTDGQIHLDQYGTSNANVRLRYAAGSKTVPTAPTANTLLGSVNINGYNGTDFTPGSRAGIYFYAAENFTETNQGTYIKMGTSVTGSSARVDHLTLNYTGNLLLKTSVDDLVNTLQVNGSGKFTGQGISDVALTVTSLWGSSSNTLISGRNSSGEVFSVSRNGAATFGNTVDALNLRAYGGGSLFLRNPANTFDWAIYQNSSNELKFDFNGTNRVLLSSGGDILFLNNLTANSLFVNRAASRNMLGISSIELPTSGDEEGVVVIKTNASIWQQSIVGYAVDSKGLRVYNTGGSTYTSFEVVQGDGSRFIVAGSGNVGIGTTSPARLLDLRSSSVNGTAINIGNTATNGRNYVIGSNFVTGTGEFVIYDADASASRLWITSGGTLLVGKNSLTTSIGILPESQNVQISKGGTASTNVDKIADIILDNNTTFTDGIIARVIGTNSNIGGSDKRVGQIAINLDGAVNSGNISFATLNAGTFGERMRITNRGNIYHFGGGIRKQQLVDSKVADASGTALKLFYVGYTHTIRLYLYIVQDTLNVAVATADFTTAYGSSSGGITYSSRIGNISSISAVYNNLGSPAYTIDVTVNYTGSAPTIYATVEGISNDTMYMV